MRGANQSWSIRNGRTSLAPTATPLDVPSTLTERVDGPACIADAVEILPPACCAEAIPPRRQSGAAARVPRDATAVGQSEVGNRQIRGRPPSLCLPLPSAEANGCLDRVATVRS